MMELIFIASTHVYCKIYPFPFRMKIINLAIPLFLFFVPLCFCSLYTPVSLYSTSFSFHISSPSSLAGDISYLPVNNARSPVSDIIEAPIVLPNKHDSITGCDPNTGESLQFTPFQDNGQSFNNTVLLLLSGPCWPDLTGLNVAAVIYMNQYPPITTFYFGGYVSFEVPLLIPIVYSDIALVYSYLSSASNSSSSSSSSSSAVLMSLFGSGPLVDSEKRALRAIAAKLKTTPMYRQNMWNVYGYNTTTFVDYPTSPSYDPCIDPLYLGGIYCLSGHVVLFFVPYVGLIGSLPSEFGQLTSLRVLNLAGNFLSGTLPHQLCNLHALVHLNVAVNNITNLPDCFDTGYTNMTHLTANQNMITNFPNTIVNAKYLQLLELSQNLISSIPSLSTLTSLSLLYLGSNNAAGTIFPLNTMPNLNQVDLHANRLSGVFDSSWLDNLPSLTAVDLSFNFIHGQLPNFTNSVNVYTIILDQNFFSGDIPASWSSLTKLQLMTASHNAITYAVSGAAPFLYAPALALLDLRNNAISIPSSFAVMVPAQSALASYLSLFSAMTLQTLKLDGNMLAGPWARGIVNIQSFPSLNFLSLSHNNITNIPSDLFLNGEFPPILHFDLSYNALTGSIPLQPPGIGVTYFSVAGNPLLSGLLPSWISLSPSSFHSESNVPYACPDMIRTGSGDVTVFVDASYDGYANCYCINGYYGAPPSCLPVPSFVNVSWMYEAASSFSNASALSPSTSPQLAPTAISHLSDSQFGNHRYSAGLDTTWFISPSPSAVVLFLNLSLYPSSFNSVSDLLTIYDGPDRQSPVVATFEGNTVSAITTATTTTATTTTATTTMMTTTSKQQQQQQQQQQVVSQIVTVYNSVAVLNLKSLDTSGTHFDVYVSYASTCPLGYQIDPNVQKCRPILPLFSVSFSFQLFVYVLSFFISCIIFVFLLLTIRYRNYLIIRSASFPCLLVMLLGLILLSSSSVLYGIEPKSGDEVCHLRVWMTAVAAVVVLATLLTKSNRIRLIFTNTNLGDLMSMSNMDLVRVISSMFLLELILVVVLSCAPLTHSELVVGTGTTAGYTVYQCHSSSNSYYAWLAVQLMYFGILLACGLYMAWSIRKVPSAYNESTHILNSMHVLLTLGLILVVLQFLVEDPNALIIIRGLGQNLIALSLTLTLFAPKFYIIFDGRGNDKSLTNSTSSRDRKGKRGASNTPSAFASKSPVPDSPPSPVEATPFQRKVRAILNGSSADPSLCIEKIWKLLEQDGRSSSTSLLIRHPHPHPHPSSSPSSAYSPSLEPHSPTMAFSSKPVEANTTSSSSSSSSSSSPASPSSASSPAGGAAAAAVTVAGGRHPSRSDLELHLHGVDVTVDADIELHNRESGIGEGGAFNYNSKRTSNSNNKHFRFNPDDVSLSPLHEGEADQ